MSLNTLSILKKQRQEIIENAGEILIHRAKFKAKALVLHQKPG